MDPNKPIFKFDPSHPRTPPNERIDDSYGDGISPLTEPNTPDRNENKNSSSVMPMPMPLSINYISAIELADEYVSMLEENYRDNFQNAVASVHYITNKFINDLKTRPGLQSALNNHEAVHMYSDIINEFVNIYGFVSTQERNQIKFIMESAIIRINNVYLENTIGGKKKNRKKKNKSHKKKTKKTNKRKRNKRKTKKKKP